MKSAKSLRGRLLHFVRWGVVIIAGSFLAWRVVVVNLSQQLLRTGTPESIEVALELAPGNPHALFSQAIKLSVSDPEEAENLLLRAIELAPSSGRMLFQLGNLLERRGEDERAEQLMLLASTMARRNSVVQVALAEYWGRHNQPEQFLKRLIVVLDLNRGFWDRVYPVLLSVINEPAYEPLVREVFSAALADRSPFWWKPFFYYASIHAESLASVRLLYSIRSGSHTPPTDNERKHFLARLQQEGQWLETYFVWLNSLDDDRLSALGNIFNGSFTYELMNEGFGWRYSEDSGVDVSTAVTEGASDAKALRITYSGRRAQKIRLSQFLKLPPGRYQLSGRVRTVAVDEGQGAQWRIGCITPKRMQITQSAWFSGDRPWRVFVEQFEIPAESCEVQQLSLAQESIVDEGNISRGAFWFDDLAIRSLD